MQSDGKEVKNEKVAMDTHLCGGFDRGNPVSAHRADALADDKMGHITDRFCRHVGLYHWGIRIHGPDGAGPKTEGPVGTEDPERRAAEIAVLHIQCRGPDRKPELRRRLGGIPG